jgi:hypothetical protein
LYLSAVNGHEEARAGNDPGNAAMVEILAVELGKGFTMPVIVWLSSGAEIKIEKAVSATIEPTPIGSGITEVWLICRDANNHAVAKFKWAGVVGYNVVEPDKAG